MSVIYLWQVRILRLAWLQHAAAWAGIPVLYRSQEPLGTLVPQVRLSCSGTDPLWLLLFISCMPHSKC